MQLDSIETFLDLLETRNFNRTAERLHITQSTVSARVRGLEAKLGAPLFERGRSGAAPTAAGLRFEGHARAMLRSWSVARSELGALDRYEGALRIAGQVSVMDRLLDPWVDALKTALPRVSLHVEADYASQMAEDLVSGRLDVAVMYTPRRGPDLDVAPVDEERFEMVATHTETLVDLTPETYIRVAYAPVFDVAHGELLPHLTRTALSVGIGALAIARLRKHGGAAYLPSDVASAMVAAGEARRVRDAPTIEQPIYAVAPVRRRHEPLLRVALSTLRAVAARSGQETTDLK